MTTQPIYRFKFSAECQLALEIFANTHRYDEISNFREKWEDWYSANANIIDVEEARLKALGCDKDIKDKMYKSVRYYFKNKSTEKTKPKKRKTYVSLSKDLLDDISRHISEIAFVENMKPAYGYNNFLGNSRYNTHLRSEEQRLQCDCNMGELEAENKIKKTYKNRFFIYQKKHSEQ